MFYMGGRARGLWMVGPEVGTFSGGLANRADKTCVEEVDTVWKFADGTSWIRDPQLKVSCEKDFTGKSSCHGGRTGRPPGAPSSQWHTDCLMEKTSCLECIMS